MKTEIKLKLQIDVILFIIFLILKLDGIIQWRWVWVFSPLWIVWIVDIACQLMALIIKAIASIKTWQPKYKHYVASGPRMVWDPKTSTLYGPWSAEKEEMNG